MGEDLGARLATVPTSTAKVILRELGVTRVVCRGLRPIVAPRAVLAGPARTVRFLPGREDVPRSPGGAVNRRLIDELEPGQVVVIDSGGFAEGAVLGDMLAMRAKVRGAAGVVADGVVRDVVGLTAVELPVFARGTHPDPSGATLLPWETDVAVQCGGVLVRPGDWVLADTDSVLVVPAEMAPEVATRGRPRPTWRTSSASACSAPGSPWTRPTPSRPACGRTWPASGGTATSPAWRRCAGGGSTLAGAPFQEVSGDFVPRENHSLPLLEGPKTASDTDGPELHPPGRTLPGAPPPRGLGALHHCSQPFCESCLSAGPRAADGTRGWFCARCRATLESAARVRQRGPLLGRARATLPRARPPRCPRGDPGGRLRPGPACSSPGACSGPPPGAPWPLPCPPGRRHLR